jgi:hypothetical protein
VELRWRRSGKSEDLPVGEAAQRIGRLITESSGT